VIDRSDGDVKILEGGRSIFKAFASWAKETDSHPGGQGGGDWAIEATGEGKMRRYQPNHLKSTKITEEEKAKVKSTIEERSLEEVFKAVPLDNLINRVFGSPNGEPEPNKTAQAAGSSSTDDDVIKW